MCGIAGIFDHELRVRRKEMEAMSLRISHRGPDACGYLVIGEEKKAFLSYDNSPPNSPGFLHFAHRRLSIIDLEGAKQPLSNEDATVWVIFNGEIYNYLELADILVKRGHQLKSKGDTEVLVHLWEEFAEDMLSHLVGMFAFAIYDSAMGILFIARDRFGQKPLFYFEKEGSLFFASEIQALRALSEFSEKKINDLAIAQYLKYGFIPSPLTAFSGVLSLPPGHYLIRKNGVTRINRYWKPNVCGEEEPDYEKIKQLLNDSVKIRMRSDVPFAAFLSSGIDSSLIVSSMVEQGGANPKTFIVSSDVKYIEDESFYAAKIAKILGTEHRELRITPDFFDISDKLAQHYGQPFADHSAVMTYCVSKGTREFVKVALTGDGGDELFAGYTGYSKIRFYSLFGMIPCSLRRITGEFLRFVGVSSARRDLYDGLTSAFSLPMKGENISALYHQKWRDDFFCEEFKIKIKEASQEELEKFTTYYREAPSENPLDKWLEADQRLYLADDILCKLDIASMAVSLECRSPFLDHRLAEYVNRIRASAKIANGKTKAILRKIASEKFPPEICSLPKKGFSMPLARWMRKELKDIFEERLFGNISAWQPYLKIESVKKMWNEHLSEKADHHMRLWALVAMKF